MTTDHLTKIETDDLSLADELRYALQENPHAELTPESLADTRWDAYHVSSPEGGGSTDLHAFGQLPDGRWVAVEAWCDYTGWGCQDGADWHVGRDRQDVIDKGMTNEMRGRLGLPRVEAPRDHTTAEASTCGCVPRRGSGHD